MTTEKTAVKLTVSGIVQGVGFRFFIYRIAQNLELTGYAKNLFSGEVEIYAEGRKELLEMLLDKAREGPRNSHVRDVKVEWLEFKNKYDKFDTL